MSRVSEVSSSEWNERRDGSCSALLSVDEARAKRDVVLEFVAVAGRRLLARGEVRVPHTALARRREMAGRNVAGVMGMTGLGISVVFKVNLPRDDGRHGIAHTREHEGGSEGGKDRSCHQVPLLASADFIHIGHRCRNLYFANRLRPRRGGRVDGTNEAVGNHCKLSAEPRLAACEIPFSDTPLSTE